VQKLQILIKRMSNGQAVFPDVVAAPVAVARPVVAHAVARPVVAHAVARPVVATVARPVGAISHLG